MTEQYPAIYTDAYGQEKTTLYLEPDGEFLSLMLRGVHLRGLSFDTFYVWPPNQDEEKQRQFVWEEGYITAGPSQPEPAQRALGEYTLQWTMPIAVVQDGQTIQGTVHGYLERKKPTAEHRHGLAQIILKLLIEESMVEIKSNDPSMGPNLFRLQQELPQGTYLKCCRFCALSMDDFYGGGLLCFRKAKEQIRAIKHQHYQNKVHHPINRLRGQAFYVQDIYLCPEFEVDLISLSKIEIL